LKNFNSKLYPFKTAYIRVAKVDCFGKQLVIFIDTKGIVYARRLFNEKLMNHYSFSVPERDKRARKSVIFAYYAAKFLKAVGKKVQTSVKSTINKPQLSVTFTGWDSWTTLLFITINGDENSIIKNIVLEKEIRVNELDILAYKNQQQPFIIQSDSKVTEETKRQEIYHHYLIVKNAISIADLVSFYTDKNILITDKNLAHWMFMQLKWIECLKKNKKK